MIGDESRGAARGAPAKRAAGRDRAAERVAALRGEACVDGVALGVVNDVVGRPELKERYVAGGVVHALLGPRRGGQTAAALAVLCSGCVAGAEAVAELGGVGYLVECLGEGDVGALRALCALAEGGCEAAVGEVRDVMGGVAGGVRRMVEGDARCLVPGVRLFAAVCGRRDVADALCRAGVVDVLVGVFEGRVGVVRAEALKALAAVVEQRPETAGELRRRGGLAARVGYAARVCVCVWTRLYACKLLAHVHRVGRALQYKADAGEAEEGWDRTRRDLAAYGLSHGYEDARGATEWNRMDRLFDIFDSRNLRLATAQDPAPGSLAEYAVIPKVKPAGHLDAEILRDARDMDVDPVYLESFQLTSLVTVLLELMRSEEQVGVRIQAQMILAELVEGSVGLQTLAFEARAIDTLAQSLSDAARHVAARGVVRSASHLPPQLLAGKAAALMFDAEDADATPAARIKDADRTQLLTTSLLGIAAVCDAYEPSRERSVELDVLPAVVKALRHESDVVQAAAAACLRSMSRSVKIVRQDVGKEHIAKELVRLLDCRLLPVLRQVIGCVCNLGLDFSPIKGMLANSSVCAKLGALAESDDAECRYYALWALTNMALNAKPDTRVEVVEAVGFSKMLEICRTGADGERQQAFRFVRNVIVSMFGNDCNDMYIGMDFVLDESVSDDLFATLEGALSADTAHGVMLQALFVVVNIAGGKEKYKNALMQTRIPILINLIIRGSVARLRLGAMWFVINIVWPKTQPVGRVREDGLVVHDIDEEDEEMAVDAGASAQDTRVSKYIWRLQRVRELGLHDACVRLTNDKNVILDLGLRSQDAVSVMEHREIFTAAASMLESVNQDPATLQSRFFSSM